jgi:hypothetical protein
MPSAWSPSKWRALASDCSQRA